MISGISTPTQRICLSSDHLLDQDSNKLTFDLLLTFLTSRLKIFFNNRKMAMNNNSLGTQIPTFGNRIQVSLDRAVADDLAAETTLRALRQELANVQRQLEEFLLGTNHSKAEIAAARSEVAEATANRDRAVVDWRITAEVLQTAESNFRQAFLPIAPPLQAPQVVPQAMPVAAPQEPRQSFVQLNYLRCTEQGNKSISDSRLFFRQSMDRLSLTDVPFRKWIPYLLTFMNETDRIWA
jgi:hypothetical protein